MAVLFLFLGKQITFFGRNVLGVTKEIPFIAQKTEKQDKFRLNAFLMHNFSKDCTASILHRLKSCGVLKTRENIVPFYCEIVILLPKQIGPKDANMLIFMSTGDMEPYRRHDVLTRSLSKPINTAIASLSSRRNALVNSFCMQNGIFSPKPGLTLEIKDPDPYSTVVAQPFISHPGL